MALRGVWALGIMAAMGCGSAGDEEELSAPPPPPVVSETVPDGDALPLLRERWRFPTRGRQAVHGISGDVLHLSPTGVVRRGPDGERRWRYEMQLRPQDSVSLEAAGDLALFRHDQTLRALDLSTGSLRWERPSTPVQGHEGALFEVLGCDLRRLSAATGEPLGEAFEGRAIAARSDGESAAAEPCRPGALILGRAGDLDVVHVQRAAVNRVEFWRGPERERAFDANNARFGYVSFGAGGLFFLGKAEALEVVAVGSDGRERFSRRFADEPCSDFHVRTLNTGAGPGVAVQRCREVWLLDADGGERVHRQSEAYVRFASELGGNIDVFRAGEALRLAFWEEDGNELGQLRLDCPGCSVHAVAGGHLLQDRDRHVLRFVGPDGEEHWEVEEDASPVVLNASWVLLRGEEERLLRLRDGAVVGRLRGEYQGLVGAPENPERLGILTAEDGFVVVYELSNPES